MMNKSIISLMLLYVVFVLSMIYVYLLYCSCIHFGSTSYEVYKNCNRLLLYINYLLLMAHDDSNQLYKSFFLLLILFPALVLYNNNNSQCDLTYAGSGEIPM